MLRTDVWLDRWMPLIRERAQQAPLLEIGCGVGDDTVVLCEAGFVVHAFDVSREAVQNARRRAPLATVELRDIRDPLPQRAQGLGVVVASLSLHYFCWQETRDLVQRIRGALRPGGVLLCRLNSTEDHHFGASGYPPIENNFFLVDGVPKRFFDEASIAQLFVQGWNFLSQEHHFSSKYTQTKALWELVLERRDT
jgi:SAM-dependent methyltransferase